MGKITGPMFVLVFLDEYDSNIGTLLPLVHLVCCSLLHVCRYPTKAYTSLHVYKFIHIHTRRS